MKVEINKDEKNPLLNRRQIKFSVTHDGKATPSKLDVAEQLAAKLNANLDLMVIEGYKTPFGENKSKGICFIYEDAKSMNRAEPIKLLNPKKRVGGTREEKKPEAEAPAKDVKEVKEEEVKSSDQTQSE